MLRTSGRTQDRGRGATWVAALLPRLPCSKFMLIPAAKETWSQESGNFIGPSIHKLVFSCTLLRGRGRFKVKLSMTFKVLLSPKIFREVFFQRLLAAGYPFTFAKLGMVKMNIICYLYIWVLIGSVVSVALLWSKGHGFDYRGTRSNDKSFKSSFGTPTPRNAPR